MSESDHTDAPHPILRGEFTVINNRVHVHEPKATATHAMAAIHQAMVLELSCLNVPNIHVTPEPEEFEDTADYMVRVAQVMDRWLKAVGEEVKSNSMVRTDLTRFEDQFFSAVEGNATFEAQRSAEAIRHEREEYPTETDYAREQRWLDSLAPGA